MDDVSLEKLLDKKLQPISQQLGTIVKHLDSLNNKVAEGEKDQKETEKDVASIQATCTARASFSDREHDRLNKNVDTNTNRLWSFVAANWQGIGSVGAIVWLLVEKGFGA